MILAVVKRKVKEKYVLLDLSISTSLQHGKGTFEKKREEVG